ncbi:MAG: NUDIX domain-containing protein [Parachlamydiaceae bacterium]|nr:NUDIX domain-containing protein [Parachlamydiaceae bacterium]
MTEMKKRPFVGVGVVVIKEGKVLLGKRKGAHGAGNWSFPGGHLEFEEQVRDCAIRELEEETSLKAVSIQESHWVEDIMEKDNKHYITLYMIVTQFQGEPQLLEPHKCEGWQWFAWDALPSPLFVPIHSLIAKVGIENLQLTCCEI